MTNEEKPTALVETGFVMRPDVVRARMNEIEAYQRVMRKGEDYGLIPGTPKPTLFQPGADTLCIAAGLCTGEPIVEKAIEDWEAGFFYYLVKQPLLDLRGAIVAWGVGSCSSREDRYAYRWVPTFALADEIKERAKREGWKTEWRTDRRGRRYLSYRVPNEDPYSLVNTILKMAVKRAYISATLRATGAHRVFTQDVEDLPVQQPQDDVVEGEYEEMPVGVEAPEPPKARRPVPRREPGRATSAQLQYLAHLDQKEAPGATELVELKWGKSTVELTVQEASDAIEWVKSHTIEQMREEVAPSG